jgi:hypothetical protein
MIVASFHQITGFAPIGILEYWYIGIMGFGILEYWVNGKIRFDDDIKMDNFLEKATIP